MNTAVERMQHLVGGDRVSPQPISMWKHFPMADRDTERLAKRVGDFQNTNGWDFLKIPYNGLYSIEDWGSNIAWPTGDLEVGTVVEPSIRSPEDWARLEVVSVDAGALGRELATTGRLVERFGGTVPVIGTVFSPLTTAIKMTGEAIFDHITSDARLLHRGLEVITATTVNFVRALVVLGVDGIFFATQLATRDRLDVAAYHEFGRGYDLEVLAAAEALWFNMLHIHGAQPMFQELEHYPVAAINWHDRITSVSLRDARTLTDKILIGGIDENDTLATGSDAAIEAEAREAVSQDPDGRLILGPGCVVPLAVDERRLTSLSRAVATL